MYLKLSLGVSLCLNLVFLTASLFSSRAGSQRQAVADTASPTAKDPAVTNRTRLSRLHSPGHAPASWKTLQSDDLAIYTANLRAAGFPEPVLQNIIVTELDRVFADRIRSLPSPTNYWRTGSQRDADTDARRQAKRSIENERRAKIRELLGIEWYETAAAQRGREGWMMAHLAGPAAAGREDQLSGLWAKIQDRQADLKSSNSLKTLESEARRRAFHDEAVAELRRELGPEGFEELELRFMAAGVTDVWGSEQLFGCVLSGPEFRELLRIKKSSVLPLDDLFDLDPPPPTPEVERAMDEQLRALLGEERFAGYQRAKDPQFRWIHRSLGRPDGMELTWTVYDIYAGMRESAGQLRDRADLSETDLAQGLGELRRATTQKIEQALGPETYAKYGVKERPVFDWLDELTKVGGK